LASSWKQAEKSRGGEDVVAHGGVDAAGVAGNGRSIRLLLVKGHDASFVVSLNHAEFASLLARNRNCGDGHFCLLGPVEIDHAGDIHAIDVVGSEDGNQVRVGLLDEIHVLKDGVCRSLVPGFVLRTHLCRHVDDEVALQQPAELPSLTQMLEQRLAAKLGENVDRMDSGVDEIVEDKIDDPVLASEGNRRLGAFPR